MIAVAYLGLMFLSAVFPSGITSPREIFNLDWITLAVIFVIAAVGGAYFLVGRPDRKLAGHLHDELEATGAERMTATT
jgi:hypothetical protein